MRQVSEADAARDAAQSITVQPSGPLAVQIPLIREALIEKYGCQVVSSDGDLYIEENNAWVPHEYYKADSSLYLGVENVYAKASYFNVLNRWIKRKFGKSLNIATVPKLLFASSKSARFPSLADLVARLTSPTPPPRKYAVMSNDLAGPNLVSLPYFLQYYRPSEFCAMPRADKATPKRFCCAVISNPHSVNRIKFIKQLSQYKRVDIFGRTPHSNSTSPHFAPVTDHDKATRTYADLARQNISLFANYKFVVCFENSIAREFLTEKLPNVLLGRSLPVYMGAPNVGDYFNKDAFVNYHDHQESFDWMVERVIDLDQDDQQYAAMLNAASVTSANLSHMNAKLAEVDSLFSQMIQVVQARKSERVEA